MKFYNTLTEENQPNTAFQFVHKGWTISVSNMFGRCEVLVFNHLGGEDIQADSVQDAIEKVNLFFANYPKL